MKSANGRPAIVETFPPSATPDCLQQSSLPRHDPLYAREIIPNLT
jgi:hypothetical protein